MLTVDQIKNISFKKATVGGYRCEEVDAFIDEVTETVEELKKKNAEIVAKSELLVQRVEEMRSNEDSVSTVLVKAQKEADKTEREAKKASAQMIKDAKAEADRIIADANNRIIREKELLVQITEEAAEIRQRLIENFEQQIESLKVLPERAAAKELETSLDERYPTQVYSTADKTKNDEEPSAADTNDDDSSEEGFDTIEEAAADAAAATADSASAEAAAVEDDGEVKKPDDEPLDPDDDDKEEKDEKGGKIQIDKSKFENRFGKLKFGDGYDVKKGE